MEACSNQTCQQIKRVYERFYKTLPEEQALPLVKQKLERHQNNPTTPCPEGAICMPLLELISRIDNG